LRYSETDRDNTVKKIAALQKQLDKMREELETFDPTIRAIESVMKERDTTIEDTKDKMNTVEDRFVVNFWG
jgi:peptidoglycan hydrolase CwlO-like protein